MKPQPIKYVKGQIVKHEDYGMGVYSHRYAEDASVVQFEKETKGHKTRVVRDKTIQSVIEYEIAN